MATRMLCLSLEYGPKEAVQRVARDCDVDQACVSADLKTLLIRLQRNKLLSPNSSIAKPVQPSRFHLWLLLLLAWVSLRLFGWARTIRLWRCGRKLAAEPLQESMIAEVQILDRAVRTTAAIHPLNPQCKERAVVTWHILRNRWGIAAELVVGILAFPFQAHAWVECGDQVLTDERTRCEMFTPAARYQ